jgi:putative transposase
VLVQEGHHVNRKKIQRLWREEGLRVPQKRRKRQRMGASTTPADRLAAIRPDHVWALDFQFDVTATGRVIKILHVVDEFTRESLSDLVAHSIDADATVDCLDRIVARRGTLPEFIRCDNGPELTANALRDWCRFSGAGTSYIDPGSPWQNPWVESYGSRIRDELLAIEQFDTLLEAQVLVEDWRTEYNEYRPHSALGMLSPAAFSRQWRTNHQPKLSLRVDQ